MRVLALSVLLAGIPGLAEAACSATFAKLRYDDDLTCIRAGPSGDALDRLKPVPMNAEGDIRLSLGGEIRQRYEFTKNPSFGVARQDKAGVWLQRYALHTDLRLGSHVRIFGQLLSALESGRAGGGSPVDENELELQNAFFDLSPHDGMTFRLGRQEVQFGSGRLVDVREGPNVRRSFDGARAFLKREHWRFDVFALRPRLSRPEVFDDASDSGKGLWGVYATAGEGVLPAGGADLYYLGYDNDSSSFVQGTEEEHRHSLGLRLWGEDAHWDWNWEAVYQFGSFGAGDIEAWTVASETGYRWDEAPWHPRIALSANIATGDDDPADGNLGTFSPLFPRGNYFSEAAVLGPRNFYNLHGILSVKPAAGWSLTAGANFFWRMEKQDGVYTPGGSLLRGPGGSDERFVASAFSFSSEHALTERVDATAIYTRLFSGPFIKDTGPGSDIDFIELTLRFRF